MNRWHPFLQLVLARLKEFYREPIALFWVYGFPLIMALVLGIAFSRREPEPSLVDIQDTPDAGLAEEIRSHLEKNGIKAELHSAAESFQRLKTGKTELYLVAHRDTNGVHVQFHYDKARDEADKARLDVTAALDRWRAEPSWTVDTPEYLEKPGTRYIDRLWPGLLGLNLMGGGMWGMGFVLVEMRSRKLLKRLLATPMHRSDFLLALITARLLLVIPEMTILVSVAVFAFRVPLDGNLLTLILVFFLAGAAFSGLGLLIACRTEKTETVQGLMNLVIMPQWLLSGALFSSSNYPDSVQPFIQALPATQAITSIREIMLEGAGLPSIAWRLGVLVLWGAVSFFLALRWFRWR